MKVFISQALNKISVEKANKNIERAKKALKEYLKNDDIIFVYRDTQPDKSIAGLDTIQLLTQLMKDCDYYAFLPGYLKSDMCRMEYSIAQIASREHGKIINSCVMEPIMKHEDEPMELDDIKEYIAKAYNAKTMVFELDGSTYPIYDIDTNFVIDQSNADKNCEKTINAIILHGKKKGE